MAKQNLSGDSLPDGMGEGVSMMGDLENYDPNDVVPMKEIVPPGGEGGEGGEKPPAPGGEGGEGGEKPPEPNPNLDWLNGLAGTEFKTEDEIKSRFTTPLADPELSGKYETLQTDFTSLQEENKGLKDQINPLNHFVNEKEYVRQQMLKKHPDLDPTILTSIVLSDLNKLSPIDVLKMQKRISYPDIQPTDSQLTELIEEEFGITATDFDIEDGSKEAIKVKMAVADAKKGFQALQADIEVPNMENIEKEKNEKIAALSEQWKPFTSGIANKLDKVELTAKDADGKDVPVLEYEIDDKFKTAIESKAEQIAMAQAKAGREFTQEMQDALVNSWKQYYLMANLAKIILKNRHDTISNMSAEEFQTYSNPSLRVDTERPEGGQQQGADMAAIEAQIMGYRNNQ